MSDIERLGKQLAQLTELGKIRWEFDGDLLVKAIMTSESSVPLWRVQVRKLSTHPLCNRPTYDFAFWRDNLFMDEVRGSEAWIKELWTVAHKAALELSGAVEEMLQALDELGGA